MRLASGKTSSFYFNMKPLLMSPEGASLVAGLFYETLQPLRVDYVGGVALGAVPLVSTLVMLSEASDQKMQGFFVRKEQKDHGTQVTMEGLLEGETLQGKRVAILEDVTTTGGSAMKAVQVARRAGGRVLQLLTILDREEGAADFFKKQDVPFKALMRAGQILE